MKDTKVTDRQAVAKPTQDTFIPMPLSALKPRSDSAIIRKMLKEIETAFSAGASREDVWKTLRNEEGLSCNFGSFAKALLRARQGNKATLTAPPSEEAGVSAFKKPLASRPGRTGNAFGEQKGLDESETNNKADITAIPDRIKTEKDFRDIRENTDFTGLDTKYE
jgi:hypothetical protein